MSRIKRLKELHLAISSSEQLLKDANEIRSSLSLKPVKTVSDITNSLSTREKKLLHLTLDSTKANRTALLMLGVPDESDDLATVQQKIDNQLTHVISNREKQSRDLQQERGIQLRDKTDVLLYVAYLDLYSTRVGEQRLVRRVKSLMTLNGAPEDGSSFNSGAHTNALTEFKTSSVICDAKTFAHVTNVKFS